MGIVGLGTDIVKVDSAAFLRKRNSIRFLHRVFHPKELADCIGQPNPDRHLAVVIRKGGSA